MQIIIKVLKGQDCPLDVASTTTILEIKQEIEKTLNIPLANQKILLLGRTLNDENAISTYPTIKDGSKLNLIVMKPDGLRDVVHRSFRKYFNERQSNNLTREFMLDFEQKLKQFSLDDIERLTDSLLCI